MGELAPALSREQQSPEHVNATIGPRPERALGLRILAVGFIVGIEILLASLFWDGGDVARSGPLSRALGDWGAWALRCGVCFAGLFATFAYLKDKAELQQLAGEVRETPIRRWLLIAHVPTIASFAFLSGSLFSGNAANAPPDWVALIWFAMGSVSVALVCFSFFPWPLWRKLCRVTGNLWAFALGASMLTLAATNPSRALWSAATQLTFSLVRLLLRGIIPDLVTDASTMMIRTPRFRVFIAPECSGLEGAGLILAFGLVWLWLFRKESRFPQALALVPVGVSLIFLLNTVRIAVLVLIGDAGARQIAAGGFHSQAGWISFNAVAFGFSLVARRSSWFSLQPAQLKPVEDIGENPATPYLMPFLGILAAGMLATAASGKFEWLYPLRFLTALVLLWVFRDKYRQLDWRFGWLGPALGTLVFLLWIAAERWSGREHASPMPEALLGVSVAARLGWIAVRTVASVVTVPIAEELAFRGYLMRRWISADFESVPYPQVSWIALVLSSLVFGAMHGSRWLPGTAAGALYTVAALRRGRIGEAVAAHATTNLLISLAVVGYHQWGLW